jgi:hypothetical protein
VTLLQYGAEALQAIHPEVKTLGAQIVVLTPELERYKEGIIRAADVNADYTIRPEPSDTLKALRALKG